MTIHYSSREFNQQVARARRATRVGPVFITNRGEPEQVLLSIGDYRRLTATKLTLGELLSNPEVAALDFDIPPRTVEPIVDPFADDD